MKFLRPTLVLLSVLASYAQAQVTTTPVGFVTMSIAGNGGSGQPAYTFASLGLVNPTLLQSTITSFGTSTITDSAATWLDNAYNSTTAGALPTHFIEILSGSAAGNIIDITATSASSQTLTLNTNSVSLASLGVTAGTSYAIRQHWTIASVFGTGASVTLQGGSSTSADQVQLFRANAFVSYYYQTSGRGLTNAWVQSGNANVDAGTTVIYPDDGILIVRNQSSNVSVTISGSVKTGQTSIPVNSGYTLLGNVYATGMTLGTSNLYTGNASTGVAGGSSTSADQVMFWNGTAFVAYYYQTSGRGLLNTWVQAGNANVDASSTPIPAGAALFIQRNGAAFSWVAPQFPASFN
ncbi:TIGR02597 family protein [Prosthecobacter sp.]|uniref:TIGR02597 family protein n=1 Tax=Prosthecobacter sp. TaxID=1965333 RepID=UPI0037847F39